MRYLLALLMLLAAAPAGAQLVADDLLLLANGNDPDSVRLAEYYAERRGVPEGRVLAINLPAGETIDFDAFHNRVVPQIKTYLRGNDLTETVRCVVAFRGVPVRIAGRPADPEADAAELAEIDELEAQLLADLLAATEAAEALARRAEPGFEAAGGDGFNALTARLTAAQASATEYLPAAAQRDASLMEELKRVRALVNKRTRPPGWDEPAATAREHQALAEAAARPEDREARRVVRDVVRAAGPLRLKRVLDAHRAVLVGKESGACFDSELALMHYPSYPKTRWQPNPLHLAWQGPPPGRVVMTARLDGPDDATVRRLIDDALAAEAAGGLRGAVVIDHRSNSPDNPGRKPDPSGSYDEVMRRAAEMLRPHLGDRLVVDGFDELVDAEVTGPGEIAAYVGWYAARNYSPPGELERGAVGFHVTSWGMQRLRTRGADRWVSGLLRDGIAGTLGPVDEPYLASFPQADLFLALLLRGELTLGEVYWRTNPMTSWQVGLVGDPLYRPFAGNPPLPAEALPEVLRAVTPP